MIKLFHVCSSLLLAFTVFYFRRYRHPLVLSLGETPTALLNLLLRSQATPQPNPAINTGIIHSRD